MEQANAPRRRRLIVGCLGALMLAAPAVHAQPARPWRITYFMSVGRPLSEVELGQSRIQGRQLWSKAGLLEGRDFYQTLVPSGRSPEENEALMRSIVASRPDLILVQGGQNAAMFKRLAPDIPIVFFAVTEPVAWGLVASYQRPGGNLTGGASGAFVSMVKRIELLREIRLDARRVAWLSPDASWLSGIEGFRKQLADRLEAAASERGLTLVNVPVYRDSTVEALREALRTAKADGFFLDSVQPVLPEERWVDLQRAAAIPGLFNSPGIPRLGGFASYSQDENALEPALAIVARIIRGEKPAAIPVLQPARYRFVVNLGAARELGITVPPSVIVRADEVIP